MTPQNHRQTEYLASIKAAQKALEATCQFLQIKKGTTEFPEANGCGILFEYNSNFYCFSNAHVLADKQIGETFVLVKDNTTITLGGQYFYTRLPSTNNRADDTFDITVVKLKEKTADALKNCGYNFITLVDIETGYKLSKNEMLLIAAFPLQGQRLITRINWSMQNQ